MEAALSLGANLGDRQASLTRARDLILACPGIALAAQSPIYETEPVGVPAEHRGLLFLNAVIIIETLISAPRLLKLFQQIEKRIGRAPPVVPNSPRPIDIDIIYVGGKIYRSRALRVPHSRWAERRFVVQPLADLRPNLLLPGQTATVAEILGRLPEGGRVKLFAQTW